VRGPESSATSIHTHNLRFFHVVRKAVKNSICFDHTVVYSMSLCINLIGLCTCLILRAVYLFVNEIFMLYLMAFGILILLFVCPIAINFDQLLHSTGT
jgi:hypothetical protein